MALSRKRPPAHRRPSGPGEPDGGAAARWQQRVAEVAAAERRGDAAGALALVEDALYGPDGKLGWSPERILRLTQLATFGAWLPAWAWSRWLLEQTLQEAGPAGGHDWARRQCLVYESGRLGAHPWAAAPMGGYRFVLSTPAVTVWADHGTGEHIETANIGSAAMLVRGEHAVGRLVPVEGGRMFETAPLVVPERLARAVAADPAAWLSTLRDEWDGGGPVPIRSRTGLLTDVPERLSAVVVYGKPGILAPQPTRALLLLTAARTALAEEPSQGVDVWACLAAELLHPEVFRALTATVGPADAALLARLGRTLSEPAATACRHLERAAREAA